MRDIINGEASVITPVDGSQEDLQSIEGNIEDEIRTDGDSDILTPIDGVDGIVYRTGSDQEEIYDGPHEVTPGQTVQTLYTADKMLVRNIIVNPIPSNYGLIEWNGSYLTVS